WMLRGTTVPPVPHVVRRAFGSESVSFLLHAYVDMRRQIYWVRITNYNFRKRVQLSEYYVLVPHPRNAHQSVRCHSASLHVRMPLVGALCARVVHAIDRRSAGRNREVEAALAHALYAKEAEVTETKKKRHAKTEEPHPKNVMEVYCDTDVAFSSSASETSSSSSSESSADTQSDRTGAVHHVPLHLPDPIQVSDNADVQTARKYASDRRRAFPERFPGVFLHSLLRTHVHTDAATEVTAGEVVREFTQSQCQNAMEHAARCSCCSARTDDFEAQTPTPMQDDGNSDDMAVDGDSDSIEVEIDRRCDHVNDAVTCLGDMSHSVTIVSDGDTREGVYTVLVDGVSLEQHVRESRSSTLTFEQFIPNADSSSL
ncbi:MAG: hypothetical protein MHM6MM_008237, partial [Cercozoa sp. M6MM]